MWVSTSPCGAYDDCMQLCLWRSTGGWPDHISLPVSCCCPAVGLSLVLLSSRAAPALLRQGLRQLQGLLLLTLTSLCEGLLFQRRTRLKANCKCVPEGGLRRSPWVAACRVCCVCCGPTALGCAAARHPRESAARAAQGLSGRPHPLLRALESQGLLHTSFRPLWQRVNLLVHLPHHFFLDQVFPPFVVLSLPCSTSYFVLDVLR